MMEAVKERKNKRDWGGYREGRARFNDRGGKEMREEKRGQKSLGGGRER